MNAELLTNQVMRVLTNARLALQADKADLQFVGLRDGTAELKLVMTAESCSDCIMPRESLEQILLGNLRQEFPAIRNVVLDDPRQTAFSSPPR